MNVTTWTHPKTGQVRNYLDNDEIEAIALQIGRDTDNRLSNADLDRIQAAKFWTDAQGALHIDGLSDRGKIYFIATALRTAIEDAINADTDAKASPTTEPEHYAESAREALMARMTCEKTRDGWNLSTTSTLTDAEAMALTFRAEPEQVTMGDYVEVRDANGIRIGELSRATYKRRAWGPAYVVCEIDLS